MDKNDLRIKGIPLLLSVLFIAVPKTIAFSKTPMHWAVKLLIIFFLILLVFLITIFTLYIRAENSIQNENVADVSCIYHNNLCCANVLLENTNGEFAIDNKTCRNYKLIQEKQFNNKEKNFAEGQIWVVSFNLDSEIIQDESAHIVRENLAKGIKYIQFVCTDINNRSFKGNKKIFEKNLNEKQRQNIEYVSITHNDNQFDYIFRLTQMVLFVKDDTIMEGYFHLRAENSDKGIVRKPIFFRMPFCMEDSYFKILSNLRRESFIEYKV